MAGLQNPNDILATINALVTSTGNTPVDLPTIPTLDVNLPNANDIDAKWKEFLDRAQKDPEIIKYYKGLLDRAVGDTNLAKSFLEKDYQMGVRHSTENLSSSLESLGLAFKGENIGQEAGLNQRGIAMTDLGGGKVGYAAGGQPASEVADLRHSQGLRQEAEQRTARQGIEKAGLTREKGLTNVGQNLQQKATDLGQQKKADIYGRASQDFGIYQAGQAANAQQKIIDQQNKILAGGSGGGGTPNTRSHINPVSGVWDDNYYAGT